MVEKNARVFQTKQIVAKQRKPKNKMTSGTQLNCPAKLNSKLAWPHFALSDWALNTSTLYILETHQWTQEHNTWALWGTADVAIVDITYRSGHYCTPSWRAVPRVVKTASTRFPSLTFKNDPTVFHQFNTSRQKKRGPVFNAQTTDKR